METPTPLERQASQLHCADNVPLTTKNQEYQAIPRVAYMNFSNKTSVNGINILSSYRYPFHKFT